MAEGGGKRLYGKLDQVMRWALPFFVDPHPKVRYAAVHLVGRLAIDFDEGVDDMPSFQKRFVAAVVPALASALVEAPQQPWKVRVHAAAAMINFFSETAGMAPSDVAPFLHSVLSNLVVLLHSGPMPAKQEALTAMAGVAVVAGPEEFARYYDAVMPVILDTVMLPVDKGSEAASMFKGRAIECLGLMAASAGPGKFANDAARTMHIVMGAIRQDEDETVRRYGIMAAARTAAALKQDFVPFLPELMPRLLHGAKEQVTVLLFNSDPDTIRMAEEAGLTVTQLAVRGTGTRSLGVNTQALQDVITCVYAVFNLADELGSLLAPFATDALEAIAPLVDFKFSSSVRNVATITLPRLLKCMVDDAALASARLGDLVQLLCARIVDIAVDSTEDDEEDDLEVCMHMGETLVEMSRWSYGTGGAVDNDPYGERRADVDAVPRVIVRPDDVPVVARSLAAALKDRVEALILFRSTMEAGEDADVVESLQAKDEKLQDLLAHVVDSVGYLIIKPYGAHALGLFNEHFRPTLVGMTERTAPADIKTQAVCLLDDMVEFSRGADASLDEFTFDVCVRYAMHEDAHLARACVWGLGLLAHRGGPTFDSHVAQVADVLMQAVVKWRSRPADPAPAGEAEGGDDVWMSNIVADNALSALDKLARYRARPDLVPWILSRVPLLADSEEAKVVNVQLERYCAAGVVAQERFVLTVADQLAHGFDGSSAWDEDDAFVCVRQRKALAARLRDASLVVPVNADETQRVLLQRLAMVV